MRDIRPNDSKKDLPAGDSDERMVSDITRRPPQLPVYQQSTDISRQPSGPTPPPRGNKISSRPSSGGASVPVNTIKVQASVPTPVSSPRPDTRSSRVRLGHRERMIVVVLLALLSLAAIMAGVIFLPQADIKLILRTAPLLVEEQLTIRANNTSADNVVPGSAFVREIQVQETASVTSTEVVGSKAAGTVRLLNRSLDEQKIKEQSRLVTKNGTLFYMQTSATIPPNSSTSVTVEAAEAGESGNIAPSRLNFAALDPSSQSLVYAEADQAITGGTGETVNVIKEEDLSQAKQAAGMAARTQVEQAIRDELPRGWIILEESWAQEVTNFETEAALNDRQTTIPYTARVIVRVIGYEKSALEDHVKRALEERLDQDYMLFPGEIAYIANVANVNWEEAEASITVRVTHTTIPRFSLETLQQKIAGRTVKEAQTYLGGLPGVRRATIATSPFWVDSIPRIEKRIRLDLEPEQP